MLARSEVGVWVGKFKIRIFIHFGQNGEIRILNFPHPKNQLPIELGYFCRALSNHLIEIYKLVHLKYSKIHVFGDFKPDLGQKSAILVSAERQVVPAKSNFFFNFQ